MPQQPTGLSLPRNLNICSPEHDLGHGKCFFEFIPLLSFLLCEQSSVLPNHFAIGHARERNMVQNLNK